MVLKYILVGCPCYFDDDDNDDNAKENTNINHKGLQRTANEYAEERRIYKDLISKNNNVS